MILLLWFRKGGRGLPDIYAIGLQEMVDLSAKNVLISGKLSADKAREWAALIEQCLNKHTGNSSGATAGHKAASSAGRGRYVEVAVQNMVGLCLLVFVREDLRRQHVVEVAVSKVRPLLLSVACVTPLVGDCLKNRSVV